MCICTRWVTWAMPGSGEDLAAPRSPLPPSALAGIFQRSSREGAKFRKSLVLIPWKSQPMDFFFFLFPSFSLHHEDLQGAWLQPASPGALAPCAASKSQEFSQEIPPELPTPPPSKQKAAIRNPLSV